jgi:hypothetical protein
MPAGHLRQADDRIGVDVDQAPGLSDAAALAEVVEDGAGLLLGQMGVEQRCALALGEAIFAGLAVEQPDVALLAVAGADREVAGVAPAEEGAIGILAAEAREIVRGTGAPRRPGREGIRDGAGNASGITTLIPCSVFNSSKTRPDHPTGRARIFVAIGRCGALGFLNPNCGTGADPSSSTSHSRTRSHSLPIARPHSAAAGDTIRPGPTPADVNRAWRESRL